MWKIVEEETEERPPWWFILIVALVVTTLGLGALAVLAWIAYLAFHSVVAIGPVTWKIIGDSARNATGLLALIGALVAAGVAHRTNVQRARDSASEEFRDQSHWAAEVFSSKKAGEEDTEADSVQRFVAMATVRKYAEEPPKHLAEADQMVALVQWRAYRMMLNLDSEEDPEEAQPVDEGPGRGEDVNGRKG